MSPDLQRRLRRALSNNDYFQTDRDLRGLFQDPRLRQWQHSLPEATRVNMRVNYVIADLLNNWNVEQQNALYLLVHVLYEQEGDLELQHLAEEVCIATINDQIAEWQRELIRLKENYGKTWDDPEYNLRRQAELRAAIQQAEEQKSLCSKNICDAPPRDAPVTEVRSPIKLKCPCCGAPIPITARGIFRCPYCDTTLKL